MSDTKLHKSNSVEDFTKNVQDNRKEFITCVVEDFKELYPDSYNEVVDRAKELKETRSNEFALADEDLELRFGVTLPSKLDQFIRFHISDFLEGKEMGWFIKKFPQFAIPEKY